MKERCSCRKEKKENDGGNEARRILIKPKTSGLSTLVLKASSGFVIGSRSPHGRPTHLG